MRSLRFDKKFSRCKRLELWEVELSDLDSRRHDTTAEPCRPPLARVRDLRNQTMGMEPL